MKGIFWHGLKRVLQKLTNNWFYRGIVVVGLA